MRNLKKILALVLALVMSLSLMATASAAETASASDPYTTAEDVLKDLTVFKGDYGTQDYRFDSNITRTEAAALVYRIATGDVEDLQAQVYTNHPFTDTASVDGWARGYIAYGYNAEIIKGNGDGTFSPNDPVTGYATLAMILRTMGYGRNGEFEGVSWEIQTAATAKQQGLLEGITAADEARLGLPASRALVAQILFNALLQPTAKFSALNPYNYEKDATTLGFQKFGLEEIKGVVTANEYANLGDNELNALAANKTELTTATGARTLNVVSHFSDIGEARSAYVVPADTSKNNNTYKVLCSKLFDAGNVTENNAYNAKSSSDLAKAVSITTDANTQYYLNYDKTEEHTANIRISYFVNWSTTLYTNHQEYLDKLVNVTPASSNRMIPVTSSSDSSVIIGYIHWIPAGDKLTEEDEAIIGEIFDTADLEKNPDGIATTDIVRGEVYIGTQSRVDYSDTHSEKEFYDNYTTSNLKTVTSAANGEYLKVIDNDGDDVAEYVLKTEYVLTDVTSKANSTDYYRYTALNGSTVNFEATAGNENYKDTVELALGDVILTTKNIDGAFYAEKVTPVTATIQTVVYATPKVTTTDSADYLQSGITNSTGMDQLIIYMNEKTAYSLYLDKGGHIRAYSTDASDYALLTEMYPTGTYNGMFVTNSNWIVEMMAANDAKPAEYTLLNSYINNLGVVENPFIDNARTVSLYDRWDRPLAPGNQYEYTDYLQEAINRLGIGGVNYPSVSESTTLVNGTPNTEFKWSSDNQSLTNVGRYVKADDGVYLYSASQLAYRPDTHEQMYYGHYTTDTAGLYDARYKTWKTDWIADYLKANSRATSTDATAAWNEWVKSAHEVYAVDYVQIDDTENIVAKDRMYTDMTANREVVYAVNDTQYYLVSSSGIRTFTGYSNIGAIAAEDIKAIYAVAQNTEATNKTADYWVADVIVIELVNDYNFQSISLIYNNPSQTTGTTRSVQALDNKAANTELDIYPEGYVWGNQWGSTIVEGQYGFYGLNGTTSAGENAVNAQITRILENYNGHGIYAGEVVAVRGTSNRGEYISVDMNGVTGPEDTLTVFENGAQVPVYAVGSTNAYGYSVVPMVLDPTYTAANHVKPGDNIIWVMNGDKVAFIVDLDRSATNWTNASWLADEWTRIWNEQNHTTPGKLEHDVTLTVEGAEVTINDVVRTSGTYQYDDGVKLTIKIKLDAGMDILNVGIGDDIWDVTDEIDEDGFYIIEIDALDDDQNITVKGTENGSDEPYTGTVAVTAGLYNESEDGTVYPFEDENGDAFPCAPNSAEAVDGVVEFKAADFVSDTWTYDVVTIYVTNSRGEELTVEETETGVWTVQTGGARAISVQVIIENTKGSESGDDNNDNEHIDKDNNIGDVVITPERMGRVRTLDVTEVGIYSVKVPVKDGYELVLPGFTMCSLVEGSDWRTYTEEADQSRVYTFRIEIKDVKGWKIVLKTQPITPASQGAELKIVDTKGNPVADYAKYVDILVNGQAYVTGNKVPANTLLTVMDKETAGIKSVSWTIDNKSKDSVLVTDQDVTITIKLTVEAVKNIYNKETKLAVKSFTKPGDSMTLTEFIDQYELPANSNVIFHFTSTTNGKSFEVPVTVDAQSKAAADESEAAKNGVFGTGNIGNEIWAEVTTVTNERFTVGESGVSTVKTVTVKPSVEGAAEVTPEQAVSGYVLEVNKSLEVTVTPKTGYSINEDQFDKYEEISVLKNEDTGAVTLTITPTKDSAGKINIVVEMTTVQAVKPADIKVDSKDTFEISEKVTELEVTEDKDGNKTAEVPVSVKPIQDEDGKDVPLVPVVDGKPVQKNENGTYDLPVVIDKDGSVSLDEESISLETPPQDLTVNTADETETKEEAPLGTTKISLKSTTETEAGETVTEKEDKVTITKASVVYDENKTPKRVETIVESAEKPKLPAGLDDGTITIEPVETQVRSLAKKQWKVVITVTEKSAAVTITANKVTINITFVVPSDNPDLDKIKLQAKGYVDDYVASLEKDNSWDNAYFDATGATGAGKNCHFDHVEISSEVRESASPLNGLNLTKGVAEIKDMITKATSEADVKNIFWFDPDNGGYSCMSYDSSVSGDYTGAGTQATMVANFGHTGNLMSYLQQEVEMMNAKQTFINKLAGNADAAAVATAKKAILEAAKKTAADGENGGNRYTLRTAAVIAVMNTAINAANSAGLVADAKAAVDALIKGYESVAEVKSKADTIKNAITTSNVTSTYWKETDGKYALDANQTDVKALIALVEKAKFTTALDARALGFQVNYQAVKAAYDALVTIYTNGTTGTPSDEQKNALKAIWDGEKLIDSGTSFSTLDAAVKTAQEGGDILVAGADGKITLLADKKLTEHWEITDTVTLDLNGFNILFTAPEDASGDTKAAILLKTASKNLEITGEGTISGTDAQLIRINVASFGKLTIGPDVTLNAPNTEGKQSMCIMVAANASVNQIIVNGKLTGQTGINVNGTQTGDTNRGTITVNGTIDVTNRGIYQSGSMDIGLANGSSVSGGEIGIDISAGSLLVNSGAVIDGGSGSFGTNDTPAAGGSVAKNCGIAVTPFGNGTRKIEITIRDGAKITGKEYQVAFVVRDGATLPNQPVVNMTYATSVIANDGLHFEIPSAWTQTDNYGGNNVVSVTVENKQTTVQGGQLDTYSEGNDLTGFENEPVNF